MPNESKQNRAQVLESELFSGGPNSNQDLAAAPPEAPPAPSSNGGEAKDEALHTASNDASPAKKKPLYESFGRVFETPEQLVEYTREVEQQAVEARLAAARQPVAQNPSTLENPSPVAQKPIEGPGVEELLFTDTKAAIKKIKDETRQEMRQELNAEKAEKIFWEGFYSEHDDLRKADRVVKSVVQEKWGEIAKLPVAEAKKILAKETRSIIDSIRGVSGTKVELTKTSVSALPASGPSVPRMPVVQGEPENFVSQIKKFQRRGVKQLGGNK